MFLTREDLHVFYHHVHQVVGKNTGIQNFELKCASELALEIEKINPAISSRINGFLEAYER